MIRDPFYSQILEQLAVPLDNDLFEVCARSFLRKHFGLRTIPDYLLSINNSGLN
jgi:hypothetical protein